jgi:S1-C subfamily serine protease
MTPNDFDDPTENWLKSDIDSNSETWESDEEPQKTLKLNFKFNPKVAALVGVGIISLAILASVLPGLISGKGSNKVEAPTVTASPTLSTTPIDLYAQPKLLQSFIDNSLASSVTIYCGNYSGSGWAIDLSDDMSTSADDAYPTEIVTNNHVIEGCETGGVTIVPMGKKTEYAAYVYSYDRNNDLAILITDLPLTPFPTIQPGSETHVGQWVMAVGSPGAGDTTLDGSITTGTITNIKEGVIITDTTINPGNSGGPLLNSAGQVIAVVSAKIVDAKVDSIGIARDVSLICEQLNGCTKKQLLK